MIHYKNNLNLCNIFLYIQFNITFLRLTYNYDNNLLIVEIFIVSMTKHIFDIKCKECGKIWKIELNVKHKIEVFSAECDCGTIIVGNYNHFSTDAKYKYLTNSNFEIINEGNISAPFLDVY